MLSCYPSYLSYDILFFVLDGLYCCLVSEMNDRSVAIFFRFDNDLAMGRHKCYVRILLRVDLQWFMDLKCGCFYGGPFYILHVCAWGRM
jgi:hypothetical protein